MPFLHIFLSSFPPQPDWSKCWMLPFITCKFISLLWVPQFGKNACQSWYHAITPLRLDRGGQSLYLVILSLVYLLMSPQMIGLYLIGLPMTFYPLPPHPILLCCHNNQTLLLPHSVCLFSSSILLLLYSWSLISLPLEISSAVTIMPYSSSMTIYSDSHEPRLLSSSS